MSEAPYIPDYRKGGPFPSSSELNAIAAAADAFRRSRPAHGLASSSLGILIAEEESETFWAHVTGNDGLTPPAHAFTQVIEDDSSPGDFIDRDDGIIGTVLVLPLYEVNDGLVPTGSIVRVWKGTGDYYLCALGWVSNGTLDGGTLTIGPTETVTFVSGSTTTFASGSTIVMAGPTWNITDNTTTTITAGKTWTITGGSSTVDLTGIGTLSLPATTTVGGVAVSTTATVLTRDAKDAVLLATATVLAANTYSNGSSGVGATLTATSFGALTVDGSTPSVGDRILVKNESTAANNGIYVVTTVGDGSHDYVLTRATDMDSTAKYPGAYTVVQAGSTLAGTGWVTTNTSNPTVGSTAINFEKYASGTSGGVTIGGSVSGGTANRVLFEDGSGNMADDDDLTFIPGSGLVCSDDTRTVTLCNGTLAIKIEGKIGTDQTTDETGGSVSGLVAVLPVYAADGTTFIGYVPLYSTVIGPPP